MLEVNNPKEGRWRVLCLSRSVGQTIVVDGPCVITIVEVRNERARIGIEATPDVNIARGELLDADGKRKQAIKRGAE